jgi:hypothetical protein
MKYPQVQIIIDILSRVDNSAKSKLAFDMKRPYPSHSEHPCGTACCIGGWASRAMKLVYGTSGNIHNSLAELTNIPANDAYMICFPVDVDYESISRDVAVKMLKHYRDTGKIAWKKAGAEKI